jgi:hypothetical protein
LVARQRQRPAHPSRRHLGDRLLDLRELTNGETQRVTRLTQPTQIDSSRFEREDLAG